MNPPSIATDISLKTVAGARRNVHDYRAWLLDLDGTLYHALYVRLAMALELGAASWRAIPLLKTFRAEQERLRRESSRRAADPFLLQVQRTAARLQRRHEEIEHVVHKWMFQRPRKWMRLFRRKWLLAQTRSFLARGGRTALVSDYPARDKLAALGAEGLFQVIIASGERGGPGRLKPWPDGLLLAADRLGVEAADCLVWGDRADVDGEAARRAGMSFRKVGHR